MHTSVIRTVEGSFENGNVAFRTTGLPSVLPASPLLIRSVLAVGGELGPREGVKVVRLLSFTGVASLIASQAEETVLLFLPTLQAICMGQKLVLAHDFGGSKAWGSVHHQHTIVPASSDLDRTQAAAELSRAGDVFHQSRFPGREENSSRQGGLAVLQNMLGIFAFRTISMAVQAQVEFCISIVPVVITRTKAAI
jgi:hypothetical protein